MPEIDLENPPADPDETPRRRRRRNPTTADDVRPPREDSVVESEIRNRVERTFDRIVKARRAREDEELAQAIEEEAEPMTNAFLSLTNNVPFLRMPLIMALNILEPVLAFSRVGRILASRVVTRRRERRAARAAAMESEPWAQTEVVQH